MQRPKSNKQVWGMWLAFGGGFLCLNPYFLVFALPVALAGVALIWASALDRHSKRLLSILPFLPPVGLYGFILTFQ